MKNIVIFCASLISISFASNVTASQTCTGTVEKLAYNTTTGDIAVKGLGGLRYTKLCSTLTQTGNLPAESCKIVYATLLAAKTAKSPVTL